MSGNFDNSSVCTVEDVWFRLNIFRVFGLELLTKILYVVFYATVASGPMVEHNNDRLHTIGLGP